MNRPTGRVTAAVVVALLMPAGLAAQGHQMGQAPVPHDDMTTQSTGMPMMASMPMRPGPRMLLAQREALNLSDQQVERLDKLQERMATVATQHRDEMGALRDEFAALGASETLDVGRYEKLLRRNADLRVDLQVEQAKIGQEALAALDDQQRSNVRYGLRMQQMMHPGAGMSTGMSGGTGMMGMMGDDRMGAAMDHGQGMAMMQNMQQRMREMHENCPAMSGSSGH